MLVMQFALLLFTGLPGEAHWPVQKHTLVGHNRLALFMEKLLHVVGAEGRLAG